MELEKLREEYMDKKDVIASRLQEFRELRDADDHRLFKELVFVILTSRSSAKKSWDATEKLEELGLLMEGEKDEIAEILHSHGIQYGQNKAEYIVKNQEKLSQPTLNNPSGGLDLERYIDQSDLETSREHLVDNIHGMGWKGASHFLRNIGYGNSFAIVSGYIARKLYMLELRESPEPPKSREDYMEAEQKFRQLSDEVGIDTQELDLLLWSMETDEVFK